MNSTSGRQARLDTLAPLRKSVAQGKATLAESAAILQGATAAFSKLDTNINTV
jgi:hypothetical protein